MRKYIISETERNWFAFLVVCSVIASFFMYAINAIDFSAILAWFMIMFACAYNSPEGRIVLYGKDLSKPE